jgi:hypothetical protein
LSVEIPVCLADTQLVPTWYKHQLHVRFDVRFDVSNSKSAANLAHRSYLCPIVDSISLVKFRIHLDICRATDAHSLQSAWPGENYAICWGRTMRMSTLGSSRTQIPEAGFAPSESQQEILGVSSIHTISTSDWVLEMTPKQIEPV